MTSSLKIIISIIAIILIPMFVFIITERARGQSWKEIIGDIISILPFP